MAQWVLLVCLLVRLALPLPKALVDPPPSKEQLARQVKAEFNGVSPPLHTWLTTEKAEDQTQRLQMLGNCVGPSCLLGVLVASSGGP